MSQLFSILLAMMQIARVVIVAFGLYAYLIRPRFLDGMVSAPYWFLRFYNWGAPQIFYFTIFFIAVLWPITFILGLFGIGLPDGVKPLKRILLINSGLALLATFPVLAVDFHHMEMEPLADDNFYLMRQQSGGAAWYIVFECDDPAGFSCNNLLWTEQLPAPAPTAVPLSEETIEVNGQVITIAPPFIPTATPPAELVVDTTGSEISLRVGNLRLPITNTLTITDAVPPIDLTPVPTE